MGGYALLPLVAFIVNGFTFTYVFAQHRRSPVNRAYLLLAGWLTVWMFVNFLLWSNVGDELEARLLRLYPATWVPVGFLLLNFSYVFVGRRRDLPYYSSLMLVAVFVLLALVTDLVVYGQESLHWGSGEASGVLYLPATIIGVSFPLVYSWVLIYDQCRKSPDPNLRHQLTLILAGIMLTLAVGFYSDVILTNVLGVYDYVHLEASCTIALCVCVFIAVKRYRFLSLGVEDVASELFAGVDEGVVIIDSMGRIVQYNEAAARFIDAARVDSSAGQMPELFDGYSATNEYSDHETEIRSTSGTRCVSISQYPVVEGGRDYGRILLIRDITSYRKAQDELRKHQDHLEKLVEERTHEIVETNRLLEKEIAERRSREAELKHQETILRAASQATNRLLIVPDTPTAMREAMAILGQAVGVDRISVFEERLGDKGRPEVREAFAWQQASEDDMRSEASSSSISWIRPSIEVSRGALHLGRVVEVHASDLEGEARRIAERDGVRSVMIVPAQVGDDVWGHVCFVDSLEREHWTEGEKWVLITAAASMVGAIKRRRIEDAYREGQDRLRGIVENALDLICEVGADGRYVYASPSHKATMGYAPEDLLGKDFFDLVHPDERDTARREFQLSLLSRSSIRLEVRYLHPSGEWRRLETNGKPYRSVTGEVRAVLVSRDITRRKQLEDELLKSNKLESIGILAGGIAHDFNNILGILWSNISLARLVAKGQTDVVERLAEAEKVLMRARDLTKQLLTFARGGEPVKRAASLADLVRESARFSLRGTGIALQITEADDLWPVEVDEGQMNQVFNNIFINACQAMPEGGTVAISIENEHVNPDRDTPLPAGQYVVASVKDSGVGIDPSIIGRIFDPYFTTKEDGTGLGLATAYSIVKKHGGHISVSSVPGKGSAFRVYMPASAGYYKSDQVAPVAPLHGTGRILVMDDEEGLRRSTVQLLQKLGYEAKAAADGWEAIRLYQEAMKRGRPFDVVIMDLTVPGGLGGKETIRWLREIDRDARAIASSGYSDDPIMSDYERHGFVSVLAKPYSAGELADAVRTAYSHLRAGDESACASENQESPSEPGATS